MPVSKNLADNFVTGSLSLMDDLHGAQDIDTRVKAALVKDNHTLSLCFRIEFEHLGRDVTRGSHVNTQLDTGRKDLHVHPGWDEGDDEGHATDSILDSDRLNTRKK